jgi:hypothetical protein
MITISQIDFVGGTICIFLLGMILGIIVAYAASKK